MNLNALVSPIIAAVNPWVIASLRRSNGYSTSDDGTRAPAYEDAADISIQMQPLTYNDLQLIDGLNIQGERKALYVDGNYRAVVRSTQNGGDLVTLPDGSCWLVVLELENWNLTAGWVKVCVTRQVTS